MEITRPIMRRLRFRNDEMRAGGSAGGNHMRFKDVPRMKESTLKRFLRLDAFHEHLELHRLDCESSHGMLDTYAFVKEKMTELGAERISPPRLLTGKDLIDAGYRPGPEFSRILHEVEDAQLEGRVQTRDEALELARNISPVQG